jgi:GT2 family glycosyltransferase
MNHPLVAIVILNYNGKKFLEKFLPTVIEHSNESWAQVIVADNASSDDSVALLQTYFPNIQLIKLAKNYGYAGGYNRALKEVKAEFYVMLNSDVEVSKNWLHPLVSLLQSDEKIAAVQPKILDFYQREYFEYAGAAGGYIDILGYPFCAGRVFDCIEKDEGQYNQPMPIFWASGACCMVRAKSFWKVGGFDEKFFAHQEEIDLCWRLYRAGYEVWSSPLSEVFHVGGGTLHYSNPRKVFLNYRNNLIMLSKNLPWWWLLIVIPQRLVLDGIAAWQSVFKRESFKELWAIAKAHLAYYASVFHILKCRRFHPFPYSLPISMYKQSVLWKYFIERKRTARQIFKI